MPLVTQTTTYQQIQCLECSQGLESAQWEDALKAAAEALGKVKGNEISFIAGKLADAESLISMKVGTAAGLPETAA